MSMKGYIGLAGFDRYGCSFNVIDYKTPSLEDRIIFRTVYDTDYVECQMGYDSTYAVYRNVYEVLTEEPSDWTNNAGSYYAKNNYNGYELIKNGTEFVPNTYYKFNMSKYEFDVFDCRTRTVVETFTIPEYDTSITINGFFVWKDNVYISLTPSGSDKVMYYHRIGSGENVASTIIVSSRVIDIFDGWKKSGGWYEKDSDPDIYVGGTLHASFVDEVCLICRAIRNQTTDNRIASIRKDNPTVIVDVADQTQMYSQYSIQLKLCNQDRQLLCSVECTGGGPHQVVYDFGRVMDYNDLQYYESNSINQYALRLYKEYVIRNSYSDNSDKSLYLIPNERYIPFQLTGITKTINAYNNPYELVPSDTYTTVTYTNNLDNILPIDP